MLNKIFFEIHSGLLRESPGLDRYTRRAFEMLLVIDSPSILDVGCGPGGSTLELARLTNGTIIGLDTHQPILDELERKARESGYAHRVKIKNQSMLEMDFPEESFDLIWAEGSIYIIGFEKGLREWKRFIKSGGYLAANEMCWLKSDPPKEIMNFWDRAYPAITTVSENLKIIQGCGYKILGHFTLPEDAWWEGYYDPLEKRIRDLKEKYKEDQEALEQLGAEIEEIDMYRKFHEWYGSVFFVMQKKED
jgi:ubiquinone/menaquinone biosynthesis C-methylase UbiE